MNPTPPTAHALGQSPAFPHITGDASGIGVHQNESGLTLRQYYKAAALQGLLASGMIVTKPRNMEMGEMCDGIIGTAAQFADALLAEDAAHAAREGKT